MKEPQKAFYSFFFIGSVLATDRSSSFYRIDNTNVTQLQPFVLSTRNAVTEIYCLTFCVHTLLCVTAAYNQNENTCHIYTVTPVTDETGIMSPSHFKIYGRKATCEEFGYKKIVNTSECYKVHQTERIKADATNECLQEGGHLIRITSSQMLVDLLEDIDNLGLTQTFMYIDGYKRQNETFWRFSDETVMSFIPWAYGEPNGMNLPDPEDALLLRQGYVFDAPHTFQLYFICQRSVF